VIRVLAIPVYAVAAVLAVLISGALILTAGF
jgi:hypothetical protein